MALISCAECGKQVSDKATACPNCGAKPQSANQGKTPAGSLSRLKILGGLVVLTFAAFFVYDVLAVVGKNMTTGTNATASATIPDDSLPEIDAERIAALYAENEVNADNLLRGKKMKVTGKVTSITRDVMDNPQLSFDGGGNPGAVAQLNNSSGVENVRPGMHVLVRCTVAGLTLGMPYLRDCY